jgi:calcium permeable stress-gated cation channel
VHHGSKPGQLQSREAPEPRDLYWFNVHISRQTRAKRRVIVDAFLCLLYVFWVIPVTALFLVFSQKALSARYSWIADSCANASYFCTSLGTIQPVLLLVLMNLLPPLIRVLGMAEGCSSESWNQKLTLSRYFYFQIINVFLVTTVAGTCE